MCKVNPKTSMRSFPCESEEMTRDPSLFGVFGTASSAVPPGSPLALFLSQTLRRKRNQKWHLACTGVRDFSVIYIVIASQIFPTALTRAAPASRGAGSGLAVILNSFSPMTRPSFSFQSLLKS